MNLHNGRYIVGIDPGLSGAVALYATDALRAGAEYRLQTLKIIDMPAHEIKVNGKKRRQLDLYQLARWFDLHAADMRHAYIESVHSMPKQGVSSSFAFGFAAGAVQAMVAASFVPMTLVSPRVWKAAMHLNADKDASRRLASQRLPAFSHLWACAKDDGRAEAALLALYGSTQQ